MQRLPSSREFQVWLIAATMAVGLAVTTTGCYVSARGGAVEADFEVDAPPPALQEEVVLSQPGPEFVWIGGYWDWDLGHRGYVWREGRWDRPPRPHAVWVAPHYERRGERHYYRRGHWRD